MAANTVFQAIPDGNFTAGNWTTITAFEMQQAFEKQEDKTLSPDGYRQLFIDLLIHKINHNTYGSGGFDVLHEERKQKEIRAVFEALPLRDDEIACIKRRCGYVEDMEPFSEPCECGSVVSGFQAIQSMCIEGRVLCTRCLCY